jgi:hypothetical protein
MDRLLLKLANFLILQVSYMYKIFREYRSIPHSHGLDWIDQPHMEEKWSVEHYHPILGECVVAEKASRFRKLPAAHHLEKNEHRPTPQH